MRSRRPCFIWKFFRIWFHKILKLIFQKQLSCPRNICTQHWRKLPHLTAFLEIFLYLKNNNYIENMHKVLLTVLFVYFQGKIKFSHFIWSIWFVLNFYFDLVPPFHFLKSLFLSLWKFDNFRFWKHKSVFLQISHQSLVRSNITFLYSTTLRCGSFSKKTSKKSTCAVMIRIIVTFANQRFL